VAATLATRPESDATLDAFYTRVRPGGPGWARVSRRLGLGVEPIPGGALSLVNWVLGNVLVYASLFGIGQLVLGRTGAGVGLLAVALLSFLAILKSLREETPTPESVPS